MRFSKRPVSGAAILACAALAVTPVRAAPAFQRLDFGPSDVSADGSVVVGEQTGEAVRWTASGGTVGLGRLTGSFLSYATGVSADGQVVVGVSRAVAGGDRPFRWTATGGMTELRGFNPPAGSYLRTAANGSVVVGNAVNERFESEAFRWTASGGVTWMGSTTTAADMSEDGSVVAGTAAGVAARWTESDGWRDLGATWDDRPFSRAYAVSADGSAVVGEAWDGGGDWWISDAFRWTASGGAVRLGSPGGGSSYAIDVSADGSVVVGEGGSGTSYSFIWDQARGMRRLDDVLKGHGANLTGVTASVSAISADGRVVVGGLHSLEGGFVGGFVATVPESAGLTLLAVGPGLLRRRGHRK